jgi:dihydrofolate synthase/folylpolyglutamate synthase
MAKTTKPSPRRRSGGATRKKSTRKSSRPQRRADFENYHAALKYLHEHIDLERVRTSRLDPETLKLDRIDAVMRALGSPQDELRALHVAGTNGKGSVVAMLAACLRGCGYTVGAYTSPHLTDIRDRIQIDDHAITHPAFVSLMSDVARAADSIPKKLGPPTFFELLTALAFLRFATQAVDIAVLEVGLGGRLDATNIITPIACGLTAISEDHTQLLGSTVEEIAREKAGIFKPDVPAISIPQDAAVKKTLRAVAAEVGAPLEILGDDIEFSHRFEASPQLGPHTRVGLSTDRIVFEHVPVPIPGEHQALNCGLVLALLDKLLENGFSIPEPNVIEGLAATHRPGRMELVASEPRILLDGAHNPAALSALIRSIGAHVPYDSMIMIFGCSADKDVDELLRRVALGADKVIFARARGNPRAAEPDELARRFSELSGKMHQVADSLEDALSIASRGASRDDIVCVTGSFYLVGEAKKLLQKLGHDDA